MLDVRDLCVAYLEGYMRANVAEFMISGKMLSSDLDEIKETAVKCMEEYISQQDLSDEDKEKMKENHKQWADMILKGIKQRLYDCGKIENDLQLNI